MFECRSLELKNAQGVTSAGVEWTETKLWFEKLMFALALLSFMVGVVALIVVAVLVGVKAGSIAVGLGLAVGIGLVAMPFWLLDRTIKGTPRRLLFGRDGTIQAPLGFSAGYAGSKSIGGTLDDISSIGAVAVPFDSFETDNHGVALYKQDGSTIYVARFLSENHARKVARQLNLALAAMRALLAAELRHRSTSAAGRRPSAGRSRASDGRPRLAAFID